VQRRLLGWLWLAALVLSLAGADVTVTLYNTGDLHDHAGDLPRMAAFVARRKATDPRVLFVDCGDIVNRGDFDYMITRGEAMVATLATCGLDAAVLGNHDLSFGTARAVELLDRFHYPLLDANSVWPEGLHPQAAPPYRLMRLPGVTVALVGTASEHINHCSDLLVQRLTVPQALREILAKVDAESDIVVLLTHVGSERDEAIATALGQAFPGRPPVDLILGGHDHEAYPGLRIHAPTGIAIQHSGDYGRSFGETTLVWDGARVSGRRARLIAITPDLPEAAEVAAVRDRYRAACPPDRPLVRLAAAAAPGPFAAWLGNLAATAAQADVALLPPRAVRSPLPAGDVLPAALVAAVTRMEPVCFTLPSLADLQARLAALPDPAARPGLCIPAGTAPGPEGLRVAFYCVSPDAPTPAAADLGPLAAGVASLERRAGLDLWDVVRRAAAAARAAGQPCLVAELPALSEPAPGSAPAPGGPP